jgi:hypothetical protein
VFDGQLHQPQCMWRIMCCNGTLPQNSIAEQHLHQPNTSSQQRLGTSLFATHYAGKMATCRLKFTLLLALQRKATTWQLQNNAIMYAYNPSTSVIHIPYPYRTAVLLLHISSDYYVTLHSP